LFFIGLVVNVFRHMRIKGNAMPVMQEARRLYYQRSGAGQATGTLAPKTKAGWDSGVCSRAMGTSCSVSINR